MAYKMSTARKVYIDPTDGKYYALFTGENVFSFTVTDTFPAGTIEIAHDQNSTALIPRIYTSTHEEMIPSDFRIIDENTIRITFDSAFSGKILLLFFTQL